MNEPPSKFLCGKQIYSNSLARTTAFKNTIENQKIENVISCENCFMSYEGGTREDRNKRMEEHMDYCLDRPPKIVSYPRDDIIKFHQYRKRRYCPFVIYADTESLLVSDQEKVRLENLVEQKKKEMRKQQRQSTDESDNDNDNDTDIVDDDISIVDEFSNEDIQFDDTELPRDPPGNDEVLNTHIESSFSFKVITLEHLQHYFPNPVTYRGIDAGLVFFEKIEQVQKEIARIWQTEGRYQMKLLTIPQTIEHNKSSHCYICEEEITNNTSMEKWTKKKYGAWRRPTTTDEKGPKVKDHCHWTGNYLGIEKVESLIVL